MATIKASERLGGIAAGVSISGAASDGGTLTADIAPWNGSTSFSYQWARDGVDIPGETSSTYLVSLPEDDAVDITVSVSAGGVNVESVALRTAARPALTHVILYGQSLSLGAATDGTDAIITTEASSIHKMFNGGVRAHYDEPGVNVNTYISPERISSFVALQESENPDSNTFKETYASGIAEWSLRELLLSCTGRGAYNAEILSRDNVSGSVHYANTYATVLQGSELAKAAGLEYKLGPVIFKQGEADGGLSTAKAQWKAIVIQMRDDFSVDLSRASNSDASGIKFIVDQQAIQVTGKTYGEIAVAAIELHRSEANIVCAGPTYPEEFAASNEVHMTSNGYRNYGEKLGRVVNTINEGGAWNPCHITGVSRSGTTITVNVHVPTGPLVEDTALISSVANSGFAYSGASITSVVISDDGSSDNNGVISITIDSDSSGTLSFAYENGANNSSGSSIGPRGNIRDSEPSVTVNDGKNLYNWLCNDQWSVA